MSLWSDTETETLLALWQTHTASQIARKLDRPRSAVSCKAVRLGLNGRTKHLLFDPHQVPPPRRARPAKPAPPPPAPVVDSPEMKPCALLELAADRCRWPLGELETVAVMFCGGEAEPRQQYCRFHARIARG